jgi:hypothetical protein
VSKEEQLNDFCLPTAAFPQYSIVMADPYAIFCARLFILKGCQGQADFAYPALSGLVWHGVNLEPANAPPAVMPM